MHVLPTGHFFSDMNDLRRDRWLAAILFVPLAISFVLCIASDLGFSATLNQAGIVLPATGGFIGLGISWSIGHGLYGATVFAVPIFFLARGRLRPVKLMLGLARQ